MTILDLDYGLWTFLCVFLVSQYVTKILAFSPESVYKYKYMINE